MSENNSKIVSDLRARAVSNRKMASLFLAFLVITASIGVIYFLGYPLVDRWLAKQTTQERINSELELSALEIEFQAEFTRAQTRAITQAIDFWLTDNRPVNLYAVDFVTSTFGWAVGAAGTVLSTRDGGEIWVEESSQVTAGLTGVEFIDLTTGWAVGLDGTIISTSDGGSSWQEQTSEVTTTLADVSFADSLQGWVVGRDGVVLATENGGQQWDLQDAGVDFDLLSVDFIDNETGWAVGRSGTILATLDGGTSWTSQRSGIVSNLTSVDFIDEKIGYTVGDSGTLLSTIDGGITWEARPTDTLSDLLSITFDSLSTGWVVGVGGEILRSVDGGANWSRVDIPSRATHWSITSTTEGAVYAVGRDGSIISSSNFDSEWKIFSQQPFRRPPPDQSWFGQPIERAESAIDLNAAISLANGRIDTETLIPTVEDLVVREAELKQERAALLPLSLSVEDEILRAILRRLQGVRTAEEIVAVSNILDATLKNQDDGGFDWDLINEQLPAAIILLFLLGFLNSGYRFNSQLSNFLSSRADSLEILFFAESFDAEAFETLSNALASERIQFSGSRSPFEFIAELRKRSAAKEEGE